MVLLASLTDITFKHEARNILRVFLTLLKSEVKDFHLPAGRPPAVVMGAVDEDPRGLSFLS